MMIDLGKKMDGPEMAMPSEPSKNKITYPNIYLHDRDLGLTDKDVDKEFTATVKIRVRRVSKDVTGDKVNHSIDLDILAIDLGKGKVKDGREHPLQTAIEEGLEAEEAKKKEK